MNTLYFCSLGVIALLNGLENCPPPIQDIPLLVLNYDPRDDQGNWIPYNYQADSSPQYVGTGYRLEHGYDGFVAACIAGWSTREYSTLVSFWYGGVYRQVLCLDSFGRSSYQRPFYHPNFGQYVIAVDIFSAVPTYELIEEWDIKMVNVEEYLAALE